jgi:hypothetical protein
MDAGGLSPSRPVSLPILVRRNNMRRIIRALSNAFAEVPADAPVHFHQGPEGNPAVCYATGCTSPRLKVD